MDQQDQLEELLVEWGLRRQQGEEISPEELCRDCPELAAELAELISDLKATDWIEKEEDTVVNFLNQSDKSTLVTRGGLSPLPQTGMDLAEFRTRLADSGLLTQDSISELQRLYPAHDAHSFASQLVGEKKLTLFQATVLLQRRDLPLALDRYVLLDEIGAGGMGAVFKALHQRMDRIVALKILPQEALDSPDKIKRFHREVKAAARLEHPNIVTAFDAHTDKGVHFLVMSYVDGTDLAKLVRLQGPLPPAKAFDYIAQAARGLQHAHNMGIVHRDIKPANLLVDREGNVKILDMGLARMDASPSQPQPAESFDLTMAGAVMGTVAYLAPEQAIDTRDADARSDIYSLGCTLYYLLKGRPIFMEDTTYKMLIAHREKEAPDLEGDRFTPQVNRVFHRMVAKKPEDRYQSMTQLLEDLATLDIPEFSPVPHEYQAPIPTEFVETATAIDTNRDLTATAHQLAPAHKQPRWPVATFCLLALFGMALAAGFLLKVKTPHGTIILEIDQPELAGAEVLVDDEKRLTIKTGQGQEPVIVSADQKTHKLKVVKGGFQTFTQEFQVDAANDQTIRVHLDPLVQEVAANVAPPAMPTTDLSESPVASQPSDANEDNPQRRLAESIIRGGGRTVVTTSGGTRSFANLADIRPARFAVSEIEMIECKEATDADLAPAAPIYSLETLSFPGTPLTDHAMKSIKHSDAIDMLYLSGTEMSAAGVSRFAQSENVTALRAWGFPIKPTDVVGMKGLRLYEADQVFDAESVAAFAQLHSLRRIFATVNESSAPELAKLAGLTHLRDIRIDDGVCQEEAAIDAISQLKSLRYIQLWDSFTKEDAARLQELRPDLVVICPEIPAREDQSEIAQWVLDNGSTLLVWPMGKVDKVPQESFAIETIVIDSAKLSDGKQAVNLKGTIGLSTLQWDFAKNVDDALETIGTFDSLTQLEMRNADVTAAGMAHVAKLSELEYIDFRYCTSLRDDAIPFLSKLEFVRQLHLRGTPITDAAFASLGQMQSLRILDLGNCQELTGSGLTHLKSLPRLHRLQLERTNLTDEAIPYLSELKTVRVLNIANTKITPEGAAKLQAAIPQCVVLHESLDDIPWRSPDAVKSLTTPPAKADADPHRHLAESIIRGGGRALVVTSTASRHLRKPADFREARFAVCEVKLIDCPDAVDADLAPAEPIYSLDSLEFASSPLTDDALAHIKHSSAIESLYISQTKLDKPGLARFAQSENVTIARLSGLPLKPSDVAGMKRLRVYEGDVTFDAESIAALSQFKDLRSLSAGENAFSGVELAKLAGLSHLRDIWIRKGLDEEAATASLIQLKSLRHIKLEETFTPAGAARLQELRPDAIVIHPELPAREDQSKIAQWVLDQGGELDLSYSWRAEQVPSESFGIGILFLPPAKFPDGDEAIHLKGAIGVKALNWSAVKDGDVALETIGTLDSLIQLEMSGADISAAGMAHVAKLTELEYVNFSDCKSLSDEALSSLSKLEFVRLLKLGHTPITDAGLIHLSEMPSLRILELANCEGITGSGLAHLASLPRLHRLHLEGTNVTDEAIPLLSELKTVRVLNIANTQITPEGAARLQAAIPKCVVLHESLDDIPWRSPDDAAEGATSMEQAGKESYGLSFDGEDDFVVLEDFQLGPQSDSAQEGYTVEGWVSIAAALETNQTAFDFRTNQIKISAYTDASPKNVWRSVSRSIATREGVIPVGESVKLNQFVHVAGVWDGKRHTFFMNGKFFGGDRLIAEASDSNIVANLYLGRKPPHEGENLFKGVFRQFRISQGARYTQDFVPDERFQADEDTLVLYRFDEGHGDVLKDSSGHGHDAKIEGATWVKVEDHLQETNSSKP
ncbi:protein kinase [Blastopirellula sp. JC732]|uniref:Protein kinase n=1 Tax=Blastopirellula sediminis TaxID=2894196 RepID=A0A9X1SMT0_9BACT|nr:protein kinase [Blastopirellula sediminis]MCC9604692.1 protein kinase [Blastopirellula sediminis]MCC9632009.1 protein kinase [Blastopirellula sediminis]